MQQNNQKNIVKKINRKIFKFLHPIQGEVWCLHRVIPERSTILQNKELEITPNYLEELILKYKKEGYKFVSLNMCLGNSLLSQKMVNISFDDGFSDIYHYAFPILKKHNIPFTLYLSTDFPEKKAIIWWLLLELMIKDKDAVFLQTGECFQCKGADAENRVYEILAERIFSSDKDAKTAFVELFAQQQINEYLPFLDKLTLNWEQIKEMYDSGLCEIGSHSVSHAIMTKLTPSEAFAELLDSKKMIESRLQNRVRHFSYPNSFWTKELEELLKNAGYETATMGFGGAVRRGENKYKLPRNYIVEK